MRFLTLVLFLGAAVPVAFGGSTHRTHIVSTDDDTEIRIVRESDGDNFATFRRDGIRYRTTDADVLAEIDKVMAKQRGVSREHAELGRRHAQLGREHAQLGREHARAAREHERLARRAGEKDLERLQRELEKEQREIEANQRKLEERQRALEAQQRDVESKQRLSERDARRAIEQLFERAVREGKAKKD